MLQHQIKEIVLQGISVSRGIAIGTLCFFDRGSIDIPECEIADGEIENEILRFQKAIYCSKKDLHSLKSTLRLSGAKEAEGVIDTHIQMLDDPMITQAVETRIRSLQKNTESVFRTVIKEYEQQLEQIEDDYFKERAIDVRDLSKRILKHLLPGSGEETLEIPYESIFYSNELVPSQTAEGIRVRALAFISHHGGGTSHAALIARSRQIPFVSDISPADLSFHGESAVIVDGDNGLVIINPSPATRLKYTNALALRMQESDSRFSSVVSTTDGKKIPVFANVDSAESSSMLAKHGADGIGLFRTEFICLNKGPEGLLFDVQKKEYSLVIDNVGDKPITFRVFDFGADKHSIQRATEGAQQNPVLGLRAIRYLFKEEKLFRMQLKALFESSANRTLSLLYPLIADAEEMRKAKGIAMDVYSSLDEKKRPTTILHGAMIELPSAAMLAGEIAKVADFFSIGSNDLTQYTMGIDRANKEVNTRYGRIHPALVRMIALIVKSAHAHKIPVGLCGELASSPALTKLLIGLGIDSVSCTPQNIESIKKVIASSSEKEAKALARKALKASTAAEIDILVDMYN